MPTGKPATPRLFTGRPSEREGTLIPTLQELQERLRHLPAAELAEISHRLEIPLSRVFGVATFYSQFSLVPRGRHTVQVCLGTACHMSGGKAILEAMVQELGIEPGQTTAERGVTLDVVRCLSCCGLAPVVVVDGQPCGRVSRAHVAPIARRCDDDPGPR